MSAAAAVAAWLLWWPFVVLTAPTLPPVIPIFGPETLSGEFNRN